MKHRYEILAPAGSIEQLKAAVNNGCDSVYLGLDAFNARMKAPNFTAENLAEWVDYCHFFGVKVYVTVNTSIKNAEFLAAKDAVLKAYHSNADGVIVTDLALLQFAATLAKPFEVVASTQLNVHDAFGARFLQQMGADTVVCARECTFEQIEEIKKSGVGVECFLHGALCVCQSGQCLLSSMVGGNSGNRGLCAQPCRKLYKSDGEFAYLLSASDVCGLDTAQKLLDIGVTTFKIEGRNRRPEYAGAASRVYSEVFEKNFHHTQAQKNMLLEAFNRGNLPANNYLFGKNDGIIYREVQNHLGIFVGKVQGGKVATKLSLKKGDGLKVFDGTKEYCGAVVVKSGTGEVEAEFSAPIKNGMTVHRTSSVELSENILNAKRMRSLTMKLDAFSGKKAILTLSSDDVAVFVTSQDEMQPAKNAPTTADELAEQLRKIGELPYTITDIVVNCDSIFLPKSQINALRRQGLHILAKEIVARYNNQFAERIPLSTSFCSNALAIKKPNTLAVICKTTEEMAAAKGNLLIFKPQDLSEVNGLFEDFYLDLPSFCDLEFVKKLAENNKFGLVCHNVGQVQFAREMNLRYIAGTGLNIYNDQMAACFHDADTFFYSVELTLKEIQSFQNQGGLVFVDGEMVLMKLVHCPFKVAFQKGCENCQAHKRLIYTDQLNNEFAIVRRKDSRCTFELLNGRKLSAVGKLQVGGRYCVDYSPQVVAHYKALNNGHDDGYTEKQPYTRGRLFNKIN